MQNHKLDFHTLHEFSNSNPYAPIPPEFLNLFQKLVELQKKYSFPSVNNDIGNFLQFYTLVSQPKVIFEMGSGYGHSAFWFLLGDYLGSKSLEKIHLTEYRKDLEPEFKTLSWPTEWQEKLNYFQGNAFDLIEDLSFVDLALIDGGKSDYLKFLKTLEPKMKSGSTVIIDNSYWRGSFLDPELKEEHESAKKISQLHDYIAQATDVWNSLFIPYSDGLSLLRKR